MVSPGDSFGGRPTGISERGRAAYALEHLVNIVVPGGAKSGDVLEVKTQNGTFYAAVPDGLTVSPGHVFVPCTSEKGRGSVARLVIG